MSCIYLAISASGLRSTLESIGQLIILLLVFAFVIFLAWISSKLAAKMQYKSMKNSNVEVIEVVRLQNNKYLEIVRVADKYIAVGVGKDEVTMLTELNGDEVISPRRDMSSENIDFSSILSKFSKDAGTSEAKADDESAASGEDIDSDERENSDEN